MATPGPLPLGDRRPVYCMPYHCSQQRIASAGVAEGLPLTGLRNPVKLLQGLMKADAFKLDMIL